MNGKDPLGLIESADKATKENNGLPPDVQVGAGLRLGDCIYKITAIRDKGKRIILKRIV